MSTMSTTVMAPGRTEAKTEEVVIRAAEVSPELRATAEKMALAYGKSLEMAAAKKAQTEAATIVPPGLYWNVMTAGPFLLGGVTAPPAPPARPHRVIPSGAPILMLGVSYAETPLTAGYLNSKEYVARFETVNMSTVTPGPSVTLAGPAFQFGGGAAGPGISGVIPAGPEFHVFYWVTSALTAPGGPGTAPQIYDINFTIDLKPFGPPIFSAAAGFAEWHWDPDNSIPTPNPIGLPVNPGTAAGWRYGIANRVAVFPYPG